MQWSTFALLSVGKLLKSGSATSEQQTSGVHIMALIININVQSKRLSLGFYRNFRRIKKYHLPRLPVHVWPAKDSV